jgi:ectoine hydroxylase-related dioxygenase (phytanoyl-CoA dioxygenase family)
MGLDFSLWTDGPDAAARVRLLHRSGLVDDPGAQALSSFIDQGYAVVRAAVQREWLDAAWRDLDAACAQGLPLTCHREGRGLFQSSDAARLDLEADPCAVHDLHELSPACRAIVAHEAFTGLLTALFEGTPVLMQSQMLRHGSGKGTHTDFVHCPIARPLQTATVWIAAEAVDGDNGPLYVYPRSHRLPLHRFEGGAMLWPHGEDQGRLDAYHRALDAQCKDAGLRRWLFDASPGDLLVFHPRLAHGALPPPMRNRTRRSFALHYAGPDAYVVDHRNAPGGSTMKQVGRVRYHHRNGPARGT